MLKFIYGTMGSSKTIQALITAYNYKTKTSRRVFILKPLLDTRSFSSNPISDSSDSIESRIGLSSHCISFSPTQDLTLLLDPHEAASQAATPARRVVIIDEAQFCSPSQVDQLRLLASSADVYCYGLKTNFMLRLFAGSQRLLELADVLEEATPEHICRCGKHKAIINALFINSQLQTFGAEIHIGDTEYIPLCYECYLEELEKGNQEGNQEDEPRGGKDTKDKGGTVNYAQQEAPKGTQQNPCTQSHPQHHKQRHNTSRAPQLTSLRRRQSKVIKLRKYKYIFKSKCTKWDILNQFISSRSQSRQYASGIALLKDTSSWISPC